MLNHLAVAYLAILAAPALAQSAVATDLDHLVRKAFTPPAQSERFAYTFRNETTGEKPRTIVGRYDPSKPKGERVTILEAIGEDIDPKKLDARMEKNMDGEIWCDGVFGGAASPVKDAGQRGGLQAVSFNPKPPPDAEGEMKKIFPSLAAEVLFLPTAAIQSITAILPAPRKMAVVARIDSAKMSATCATAPNGRTYMQRMELRMAGSALGQSFNQVSIQSYSDLTPAR
jgi:hypothetical protein